MRTSRATVLFPFAFIVLVAVGCGPPPPPVAPPPVTAGEYRTVRGEGWAFDVPREWSEEPGSPPAIIEVREPPSSARDRRAARVSLHRAARAGVVVGPEREPSSDVPAGVEPIGVRSGPGERTLQRTSSTGSLGLTLQCTDPDGGADRCRAILGTFRTQP